jgi:hypothetical protein
MKRPGLVLLPILVAPWLSGCVLAAEPTEAGESSLALVSSLGVPIADFNGDGFADLAVGVPNDDVSTPKGVLGDAGSVHVFYGGGVGLSTANDVIWTQESPGVPGDPGMGYHFGAAVAAGDFNGDRISDLAIGAPGETVFTSIEAGTVTILYGSLGAGLTSAASETFNVTAVNLLPRKLDHFGSVLAAGDVQNDGRDDLAIGAPDLDFDRFSQGTADTGLVVVAGQSREQPFFSRFIRLDAIGTPADNVSNESFGAALAFLDVQGDGRKDLAVGASHGLFPDPTGLHVPDAGFVAVYDAAVNGGFAFEAPRVYTQAHTDDEEPGKSENGDLFGAALAAGDFNGDGRDDLAVGVPGEDWSGDDAGGINILYSNGVTLHSEKNEFFSQAALAVEGTAEGGDRFGAALVSADFNDDGYADLAVGVPGEKEQGVVKTGAVNVLYGRNNGLSALGDQFFAQDYNNLPGKPQPNEAFGSSLARGDFNTDGVADLVVGIPLDVVTALGGNPSGTVDVVAGEIEILRGSVSDGLVTTGAVELNREESGVAGVCTPGDTFGASLGGG